MSNKKNKDIRILVADDSSFMRKYIKEFLQEAGFSDVIEAGNGEMAIELYEKEKPDIILLDLIMPVQDGSVVLDKLVAKGANVVIISAMGQKKVIDRMIESGAKGYFIKPFFSAEEIKNKINQVLKED